MQRVKAFAPATIANLGVGFDILGLAVNEPGDYVTVEKSPQPGVEIVEITGDGGRLPLDPARNTAAVAAQSVLTAIGATEGVRMWIEKGLPLASGLGSSAASAVAAAFATNVLFDELLLREDLLAPALDAEEVVSGRHADNVAPALLGGLVLVTGLTPGAIHRLPLPGSIYFSLVTPDIEIPTAEARAVLPKSIPLDVLVHQTGMVAELIHAMHSDNVHLLAQCMQRDAVVEPAREPLIPHFARVRELAAQCGALATIISGAGPTICSLCVTSKDAEMVSQTLVGFYRGERLKAVGRQAVPCADGASVVED